MDVGSGSSNKQSKLLIGETAYAIRTTPTALRQWLRKQYLPVGRSAKGETAEFDRDDVMYLAVLARVMRHGPTVREASAIVGDAFKKVLRAPKREPLKQWEGKRLFLSYSEEEGWKVSIIADYMERLQRLMDLHPACSIIDVYAVLLDASKRAKEASERRDAPYEQRKSRK